MSALLGVRLIEVSLYFTQYSQNTANDIFSDREPFTFSRSMKLLIQFFFLFFLNQYFNTFVQGFLPVAILMAGKVLRKDYVSLLPI